MGSGGPGCPHSGKFRTLEIGETCGCQHRCGTSVHRLNHPNSEALPSDVRYSPKSCPSRDRLLITLSVGCRDSGQVVFCDLASNGAPTRESTMAKRKKQSSKVQKRKGAK